MFKHRQDICERHIRLNVVTVGKHETTPNTENFDEVFDHFTHVMRRAARNNALAVCAAQNAMRPYTRKAGACLMLSTMLHSIATGNMLPASTTTVCVDINPAVATKLSDRGSFQTIAIITDVGLFLDELVAELETRPAGERARL